MQQSKIEWTDHTFNPWIGCTKVSPGCANCYAESLMDMRYGRVKWGKGQPRSRTSPSNWKLPVKWNRAAELAEENYERYLVSGSGASPGVPRRPRVFCASLADWLDDEVPIEWLADLLALIHATPNLDWQLLTKRPENFAVRVLMAGMWMMGYRDGQTGDTPVAAPSASEEAIEFVLGWSKGETIPQNVWVGTSVEDQARLSRVHDLIKIPAIVRFLSMEPLLGEVDFRKASMWLFLGTLIHWVIVGGESGAGARPMNPTWARSLKNQCAAADVAFLFKQWGSWVETDGSETKGEIHAFRDGTFMKPMNKHDAGRLLDGVEHNGYPEVKFQ